MLSVDTILSLIHLPPVKRVFVTHTGMLIFSCTRFQRTQLSVVSNLEPQGFSYLQVDSVLVQFYSSPQGLHVNAQVLHRHYFVWQLLLLILHWFDLFLNRLQVMNISVTFNQQMHKVFVNTYLFLITPSCPELTNRELSVRCSNEQIKCNRLLHVGVIN